MNLKTLASLFCLAAVSIVLATDAWKLPAETPNLKPAPGIGTALVVANCSLCHSVDYISTQPPLTSAQWQATVVKMQQKYGAPIATNAVPQLVEYLVAAYGRRDTSSK